MALFGITKDAPSLANPLLDGLLSDVVFNVAAITSPLTYIYGFESIDAQSDWRKKGADHALIGAFAAWTAVCNLPIKRSPLAGMGTDFPATFRESLTFLGSTSTNLGSHEVPHLGMINGVHDLEGTFNAQHPVFTTANNAVGGYSFVTFVHEIGHALGLDHPHDGQLLPGVTGEDSLGDFQLNQSLFTVMSYNDGYSVKGRSPSSAWGWMSTPGALDIAAVQAIYGANLTTNVADNVYVLPSINAAGTAYACIWDAGGTDTISAGSTTVAAEIDLNPATLRVEPGGGGWLSSVRGIYGGFTIANGAEIENAIGGGGNDVLRGNDLANALDGGAGDDTLAGGGDADVLRGGAGKDQFVGMMAEMNGDRIADFELADAIVFRDADLATFSYAFSDSTLTFAGGALHLDIAAPRARLVVSAATAGSGVQISAEAIGRTLADDFNGDGYSDILWRNTDGTVGNWLSLNTLSFASNGLSVNIVPTDWNIVDTGDFNGDGRTDILWRHVNGTFGDWLGNANGSFSSNDAALAQVPTEWKIVQTGDFNGDGRDDIFWRHDNGGMGNWLAAPDGTFAVNPPSIGHVSTDWHIVGSGDFNGDGRDDILWRNDNGALGDWYGTEDGGFIVNPVSLGQVSADWKVAGTGDFDGDGRDDIMWRNDNGALGNWLATAEGGFVVNTASLGHVPTDWTIVDIGDYNGDNNADLLWRNADGTLGSWSTVEGSNAFRSNPVTYAVPTDWVVQGADHLLL